MVNRMVLGASVILLFTFKVCEGTADAKRLYDDLLYKSGYNKLIRPVGNNSDKLTVKLGLRLTQLIDVDEKNQIMTTNVWLMHEWDDYKLRWNPKDYGGVNILYVPADRIWLPDVVLYNNADGNYEVTLMTKATVHPTGKVQWEPPAIYKSACPINVEFFPFDEQTCIMQFGSWTYDGFQVDLKHICQPDDYNDDYEIGYGIDLKDYSRSVEWDLLSVPARRKAKYYTCCPEPYPFIIFNVTLRRKTLFYTVNLIIPCVAISFLTVLTFYLPSDSGEKITLCISILLSLTVFFLLLADLIPPTSIVVPLIGKYLLFTMILVSVSIIVTVVVLNVHFRSPSTHVMSPWVKKVFLQILPRLLMMRRPTPEGEKTPKVMVRACNGMEMRDAFGNSRQNCDANHMGHEEILLLGQEERNPGLRKRKYPVHIQKALEGVTFISDHLKNEDVEDMVKEDWRYVAMVLDRLFLWIFTTACLVGTLGIILQAPTLYDDRMPLKTALLQSCFPFNQ
ncbi:acetylcholine receptor subunit alpha-like 1 [Lingula anatina]|uniref:Acetylcholine receptor subunit alpha-like 1 n=1 Tax=Lingula anatina TaxID=7574 RepID=A0A1S3JAF6_LINAN|nr:acetylcholine receptor subunit alpha-like 1 [Lingula anatina]|eukprot:XP_013406864.1 acetylcholine receptor subunit alpha-like 1 [Lingula anatina]